MNEDLLEFEEFIEDYYDFNLLDLLEDGDFALADRSRYEIEHNPVCKEIISKSYKK